MVNTIQPIFKDCLFTASEKLPTNETLVEKVKKCGPTTPATKEIGGIRFDEYMNELLVAK